MEKKRLAEQLAAKRQRREDEERKKGRAAAKQVLVDERVAKPIYRMHYDSCVHDSVMTAIEVVQEDAAGARPTDIPIVVLALQQYEEWSRSAKAQIMLGTFGGSYKRKDQFKESGRIQQATVDKFGREESVVVCKDTDPEGTKNKRTNPTLIRC